MSEFQFRDSETLPTLSRLELKAYIAELEAVNASLKEQLLAATDVNSPWYARASRLRRYVCGELKRVEALLSAMLTEEERAVRARKSLSKQEGFTYFERAAKLLLPEETYKAVWAAARLAQEEAGKKSS